MALSEKLYNTINSLSKKLIYTDPEMFYEGCDRGATDTFRLLMGNLFYPSRTLNRYRFGNFPVKKPKTEIASNSIQIDPKGLSKSEIISKTIDTLRTHGAAVINGYFSEDEIDSFYAKFKNFFPERKKLDVCYAGYGKILPLDIHEYWLHDVIIDVCSGYHERPIYARSCPAPNYVSPSKTKHSREIVKETNSAYPADMWHVDHSCLIQAAIYFDDVLEDGSRMKIVSGSNRLPCLPWVMSDEYVDKNKLNVQSCYGKKGSIQFHCGSTYHRFYGIPKIDRMWLKFDYTTGPNILFNANQLKQLLNSNIDVESLDPKKRKILSGLIPYPNIKGYEIYEGGLIPSQYVGV